MFPSLRIAEAAAICGEAVRTSSITFTNIDFRTATIFLAVMMTDAEKEETGLKSCLPTKPVTRGRKTTLTNHEITSDRSEGIKETKWNDPVRLTAAQE